MPDKKKKHHEHRSPEGQEASSGPQDPQKEPVEDTEKIKADLAEANDKYLRLYAEMENYKKKVRRDREEFLAYCNEDLLYELLPVMDSLEMALAHSAKDSDEEPASLKQGVENTLRELLRTLDKFGLKPIEAVGRQFDPAFHHAMTQIETTDTEPETVVNEMRKGYLYKERVLRPSLVSVSKKSQEKNDE
jgi:molecular chaperone GrpE